MLQTNIKTIRLIFLFIIVVGITTSATAAAPRDKATNVIRDMQHIPSPNAIERLETIDIGGIKQWISIRSYDRNNPVLLVLHGGPGDVTMPKSWYFQRGWEEYFTVVQWDQRGAGKTYAENDPKVIEETLTIPQMISDTEEVILWLRKEFQQDKIFLLGHSWGSFLGLTMADRHPEWLHAYIGVGQGTDVPESERRGWAFAMEQAKKDNNNEAIKELNSIAPYAVEGEQVKLENLYLQRKWLNYYGGAIYGRNSFSHEAAALYLSPEYSEQDIQAASKGGQQSANKLLADVIMLDLTSITELKCPIILLNGRHDYNVSSEVAAEWFETLQAPYKKLIWFERSGHMVMNEEPGKTLVSLIRYAYPLYTRANQTSHNKSSEGKR